MWWCVPFERGGGGMTVDRITTPEGRDITQDVVRALHRDPDHNWGMPYRPAQAHVVLPDNAATKYMNVAEMSTTIGDATK